MTLEDTIRTLKAESPPCDDAVIAMAITIQKLGEEHGVLAYSLQGSVEPSVVITYIGEEKR